jgi:hypothetical protein
LRFKAPLDERFFISGMLTTFTMLAFNRAMMSFAPPPARARRSSRRLAGHAGFAERRHGREQSRTLRTATASLQLAGCDEAAPR